MKIPNNFDLRSLQVFVVTAEQGGMTQSAKVLRMTQSAVSQIIAGLEDSVGVKLFDRAVRPIMLTSAGRILLERARQILRDTKEAFRETQTLEKRRLASLTIAMTDSMAAVLGSQLYKETKNLSGYWRFWSGLSPYHREEFLSHNIDIIIATSNVMEDIGGLNRFKVFQEPYVLIFPKDYKGSIELQDDKDIPFLRISLRSAMGLRIESQLNRLRLKFPDVAEFDRAPGLTMAVAEGLGWGIMTPLCLLEKPDLLEHVQVHPIKRGAFSRHFDLLAREDSLGDVPQQMASIAQGLLKNKIMPSLYEQIPWLEEKLIWEDEFVED
ncbi:MAG: LysR family transcriptional regulator [Hyphomonadaceae bacterium]|nr:LysR family transcriptional regulator [Hyphomonadaceae bacterium]